MYEIIVWGVLFIAFVVAESLSAQFVSIWFAAGSLVALIISIFTNNLAIQIVAFIAVSILLLAVTRPLLKKFIRQKHEATNADSAIEKEGILVEEANVLSHTGRVSIDGLSWNARPEDGVTIPAGTTVKVVRIQGVTVFVKSVDSSTSSKI